jgi:hypothetical protein
MFRLHGCSDGCGCLVGWRATSLSLAAASLRVLSRAPPRRRVRWLGCSACDGCSTGSRTASPPPLDPSLSTLSCA